MKEIIMKSTAILILILFAGVTTEIYAQKGSLRIGFQSPNAASLGKFGEVPVSLYTGTPNITIPIYNVEGNSLNLPVTLNYHAQGNRVEEIASWVGLGWALKAGGVITRTVVGLPDEIGNGYYHTGDQLYSGSNWPNPSQTFFGLMSNESVDTEPDMFFFLLPFSSGKFVMTPKNLANSEIRTVPYQKVKITPDLMNNRWTLVTPDGVMYIFGAINNNGAVETTTDYNYSPGGSLPGAKFGVGYTSAWYLAEIHAPNSDEVIEFEYTNYGVTHKIRTYKEKFLENQTYPEPCVTDESTIVGEYDVSTPKLQSISWNGGRMDFIANTLREDALSPANPTSTQQEYQLDEIQVFSSADSLLKKVKFDYSYFRGDKRLRLDEIQEFGSGNTQNPPYTFEYDDQPFPARTTSYAVDHWGYYNAKTSNASLIPEVYDPSTGILYQGADREPDPSAMKVGILEKITYPTGGYTMLTFEANKYGSVSGDTTLLVPGNLNTESVKADGFAEGGIVTKTKNFTVGGESPASADISAYFTNNCGNNIGCPFVKIEKDDNTFAKEYREDINEEVSLAPGSYTLTAYAEYNQIADISVQWRENYYAKEKLAGGLRIKEVRSFSSLTDNSPQVKKYEYKTFSNQNDPTRSSGVILREPTYHYWYNATNCNYLSRSSVSKTPLGMTRGSYVGYKEVTVIHGENGEFGKEVHHFRTAEEAPDYDYPALWPFGRKTSQDWKRGQLTRKIIYDSSGVAKQTVVDNYTFTNNTQSTFNYRGLSFQEVNSNISVYNAYEIISTWTYLNGRETTLNDQDNNLVFSVDFIYSSPSHLQLTRKIESNSDGQQRITEYTYAHEITDDNGSQTGGLNYTPMEGLNMLSQPYSVTVKDSSGAVLSKEWTRWELDSSTGWWRPTGKWIWEGGNPDAPIFE